MRTSSTAVHLLVPVHESNEQYSTAVLVTRAYWYMIDDDLSKIPFLHTVYVPVYVLLVLVRVHIQYSFIDCIIPVLVV